MHNIFITGTYRTGTTLLEKLLNNHDKVFVASQPYPELFWAVKQLFLTSKGKSQHYPFEPMFPGDEYNLKEFLHFLVHQDFSEDFLDELMKSVETESGDTEKAWIKYRLQEVTRNGDFLSIHRQLINLIAKIRRRTELEYTGSKEILCEEFIPYMAREGNKVIMIIRDPRDMASSLAFGKSKLYTGDYRPMLYSLRLWRKSVAFVIASSDNADFLMLKYEDLVRRPRKTLKKVTSFLELEDFPEDAFVYGIEDQTGKSWVGNSSFGTKSNIDASSIGIHQSVLSEQQVNYIETVCAPEMKYLGYDCHFNSNLDELEYFSEPVAVMSQGFEDDYSVSPENLSLEKERLQKLWMESLSDEECRKWFIFPTAFEALRMQKVDA